MPCFAIGTMIATKNGDVRAEDLRPGQFVITRDHGLQEVQWIGTRAMTGRYLLDNPHLRPIFIKANAFGEGLPYADMMVSPNLRLPLADDKQRFLFGPTEEMVAIKKLADHRGIQQIDMIGVTYVHIMFESHEVVAANGIWAECFLAGDYSLKTIGNSQRNEIFEVFPELRASQARRVEKIAERRRIKRNWLDQL